MQTDRLVKTLDTLKIPHKIRTGSHIDEAHWNRKILSKEPTFDIEYLSPEQPMPCLPLTGTHTLSRIDLMTIEAVVEHQYNKIEQNKSSITDLTTLAQTFPYPNTAATPYYAVLSLILSQISLNANPYNFEHSIQYYKQFGISIIPITYRNTQWSHFYAESSFHGSKQLVIATPRNKYMAYNTINAIVQYLLHTLCPYIIPDYLIHHLIAQTSYDILAISKQVNSLPTKSHEIPSFLAEHYSIPNDFATSLARICNTNGTLHSKA